MGAFSGSLGSVFIDIDGDLSKLQAKLTKALPEAQRAGAALSAAVAKGTSVTSVGDYFSNLGAAVKNFQAVTGQAIQSLQQFTPQLDKFGSSATNLGTKLSIGVTLPLVGLATAALKSRGDLDQLERGLVAVTGSSAEAQRQLAQLREVAKLPGLGMKEAAQGAISLQALGFSADKSQKILLEFGNALAIVGRGKDDLNEVIRQLGQLGARGVVTADNLRPLIERVPQLAALIKKEFGAEALSNPAEAFKKLGVSAEQFIDIVIKRFSEGARATGGLKNDIENFTDTLTVEFGRIGKELEPFIGQFVNAAVPAIHLMVDAFTALPTPLRNSAVALGIFGVAAGPIIGTIGQLSTGLSATIKLLGTFSASASTAAVASAELNLATGTAGAAGSVSLLSRIISPTNILLASFGAAILVTASNLNKLEDAANRAFDDGLGKLSPEKQKQFTERLKLMGMSVEQFKTLSLEDLEKVQQKFSQFDQFTAPVTGFKVTVEGAATAVSKLGEATDKTGPKLDRHAAKAVYGATTFERFEASAKLLGNAFRDIPTSIPLIDSLPPDIDFARLRMDELREETRRAHEVLEDLNNTDLRTLGEEFDRAADRFRGFFDQVLDAKDVLHDITAGSEREVRAIGDVFDEAANRQGIATKKTSTGATQLQRQVSTVMTDMSRDIAKVILEGGKLGDVFMKAGRQIEEAILRLAIENGTKRLIKELDKLLDKIPGVGTVFNAVFGDVTPHVFSGGGRAATAAAGSPLGGFGGGGGGAGAATGALGTVSAVAGIVTGAISAVSGVIGNFQFAHMNTALGRIEESTRYMKIGFLDGEQAVQPNVFRLWQLANEATKSFWGFTAPTMTRMLTQLEGINAGGGGGTNGKGVFIINVTNQDPQKTVEAISNYLRSLGYRYQTQ